MSPPVIQRFLEQLDRISIPSIFKSSKPHSYEPVSMADLTALTSAAKADMDFSEDVEASRASSKQDEHAHIQRVELTEEDVCFPRLWSCRC